MGSFTQSGGTNNVYNGLWLGYNGGYGAYSLSASGLLSATGGEIIGWYGPGKFTQSGGTNEADVLTIGDQLWGIFSSGTYNLGGSGLVSISGCETVGYSGTGSFLQSGGTNNASSLCLALNPGSGGTYQLNGGILAATQISGGAGTSVFSFNGGTLQAAAGGTLMSGLAAAFVQAGGANIDTNGQNIAIRQSLLDGGGGGGLTKFGSGALTLTGSNTYTGPTTVTQGKLVVDGSLASPVTVNSGGTLGGTGSLTSVTIYAGGNIAPGDSLGTLSVGGNLILSAGAVMDYELDTPSTSSMISCGALTLNGQQFSDFNFMPSANFALGSYPLIAFGSTSGSLGNSTSGTIDGFPATLAVEGNDLVVNVVPEPSTAALLATGLFGLIGWKWRQRTRKSNRS